MKLSLRKAAALKFLAKGDEAAIPKSYIVATHWLVDNGYAKYIVDSGGYIECIAITNKGRRTLKAKDVQP